MLRKSILKIDFMGFLIQASFYEKVPLVDLQSRCRGTDCFLATKSPGIPGSHRCRRMSNKIANGFESGLHTGMILIDLQKAFDTIDHEILINKLEFLGFSKNVILWFKSYLSNRKFKVNLNKTFSESGKLLCGVPQGSILGPLLFLLYINDMPQTVKCELLLLADDACLIFQHNDIKEIEIQLNKSFSLICDWFVDNELSIHFGEDKTKSILLSSKRKVKKASPLNIQYKDKKIKQYSKVTYLGCILDETLSGDRP